MDFFLSYSWKCKAILTGVSLLVWLILSYVSSGVFAQGSDPWDRSVEALEKGDHSQAMGKRVSGVSANRSRRQATADAPRLNALEPVGTQGEIIPLTALGRSAIGLKVQAVSRSVRSLELRTPGIIEIIPNRKFDEHSPVSGRVLRVSVNLGDTVKAGQVLLFLESPELNATAAEIIKNQQDIETEIAQQTELLDNDVKQAQAKINLAQANYSRDSKLMEEKIGSQKTMQTSLAELEMDKSQLKTAIDKRELTVRALQVRLRLTIEPLRQRLKLLGQSDADISQMLKSGHPIAVAPVRSARLGTVTFLNASPGQSIDPGVRLFTVADLSRVWATAHIYEDDIGRIRKGQPVTIRVPAFSDRLFHGFLSYIGDGVDPQTRTLPVRAEIANPGLSLKPNMYADLVIQTGVEATSIFLPSDVVVSRGGRHFVFVEVKDGFQPVPVVVSGVSGDNVEIIDGLSEGTTRGVADVRLS